jgi:hypothetical protein
VRSKSKTRRPAARTSSIEQRHGAPVASFLFLAALWCLVFFADSVI